MANGDLGVLLPAIARGFRLRRKGLKHGPPYPDVIVLFSQVTSQSYTESAKEVVIFIGQGRHWVPSAAVA
jgi:hypothetical protein